MKREANSTTPGYRALLFGALLAFCKIICLAAPTPSDESQIRADCRLEGEAGGLSGSDLDQFVEECVADLQSVQFSNTAE